VVAGRLGLGRLRRCFGWAKTVARRVTLALSEATHRISNQGNAYERRDHPSHHHQKIKPRHAVFALPAERRRPKPTPLLRSLAEAAELIVRRAFFFLFLDACLGRNFPLTAHFFAFDFGSCF